MKLGKVILWNLLGIAGVLSASPANEAVPWTKSFLEVRPSVSCEILSVTPRCGRVKRGTEGTLLLSSSLYPDLEVDLGLSGHSSETSKFAVRLERQICSDIVNAPVAVTAVGSATVSTRARSRDLLFFDMAQKSMELGIGIGRHLLTTKDTFTQFFSYILVGVGTNESRWTTEEIGVQETIKKHRLRISLSRTDTFGKNRRPFMGVGTVRTSFYTGGLSYSYQFLSGLEARVSWLEKVSAGRLFSRDYQWLFSLSFPLSI